jgi:hypothetical protein
MRKNMVAVLLFTIVILTCNGCTFAPTPTTPTSPSSSSSSPEPVHPTAPPPEVISPQPSSAVSIIECPDEAHIGEYITVKLTVPEDQTLFDEYNLYICNERSIGRNWYDLGRDVPDSNRVVCWYAAIPHSGIGNMYTNPEKTEYDDVTRPGVFKLLVVAPVKNDPLGEMIVLERNIIIKD